MSLQISNIWSIFSKSFWESTLKKDVSYHIFFWVSLYVILVVLDTKGSFAMIVVREFITVVFFAMMVYINIYFLFPNYLSKKNLLHHLLSLAITALLITPIKTLCLLLIATDFGNFQAYLLQL